MKNLQLKKNIEHIYAMGGSIRTKHPNAYCSKNSTSSCGRQQCGNTGNLYTDFTSNPCAEFNMFADPFAAYQAVHSGIPITLIPLDATNTIPISKEFFEIFEKNQKTYEAQYCFSSLKIARDTWPGDQFYKSYSSWDSFASSIAVSIMHNSRSRRGENKIAEMEYMNITVVTSNEPYGVTDCSNPFFHMQEFPRFHLKEGGVHSGHVQSGLRDPFCIVKNGAGRCKDGCTEEVAGPEGVPVLVATKAKFNKDKNNPLNKVFFISFLDSLNRPEHAGRFNFTTQFPYYKEVLYKPDFRTRKLGKPIVFDMDMSAGDFLALFYLLKVPVEVINLKAIFVTPTGWANAATIDVVYDLLHMMGRDDIPVGLGDMFAMNQSDPVFSVVGNCKYVKAIPHGSGGYLDSDTLYGLARDLPRSPRRYTAHNSLKYGAPRDTDHPELRQPSALEIWASVVETLEPGSSVTILANGPLTTLAKISRENTTRYIKDVYVVGGNIMNHDREDGNVFTVESNKYAEFNLFLDPLAAKTVFESGLAVKLIPLSIQRRINSFELILQRLNAPSNKTPEAFFAGNVLSSLHRLKILRNERYRHVDAFLGETLGAVLLAAEVTHLNPRLDVMPIKVLATGDESSDGQIIIDTQNGKPVGVFEDFNATAFYDIFASRLLDEKQSASVGSFDEQRRRWSSAPDENN